MYRRHEMNGHLKEDLERLVKETPMTELMMDIVVKHSDDFIKDPMNVILVIVCSDKLKRGEYDDVGKFAFIGAIVMFCAPFHTSIAEGKKNA
jgi:hypothetical protein